MFKIYHYQVTRFPTITLAQLSSEQIKEMEHDYALPVQEIPSLKASWLAFQEVEDHPDGNGISSLWITQGMGVFYYEGLATKVDIGDIIIFDDNLEHGFSAKELCLGLNLTWGEMEPTQEEVIQKINAVLKDYPYQNSGATLTLKLC